MYHVQKESQLYCGRPYKGALSKGRPAQAETAEEAIEIAKQFTKVNPCGWNVFELATGECIYGIVTVK